MSLVISEPAVEYRPKSKILRCNKKNKCKICGHDGWCTYTDDYAVAFCMRESYGSIKQAANRSFVHILNPYTFAASPTIRYSEPKIERASVSHLDFVYSTMLDMLKLNESHKNDLLRRGLSHETIRRNGYKSLPTKFEARRICSDLSESYNLENVPGFYMDNGWQLNVNGSGYLVPYRNEENEIQGMQIRLDRGNLRYIWFSSAGKEGGTSSGSPIHFTKPERVTTEITITEGALKGDVIGELADVSVVSMAGVTATNFDSLAERLRTSFPNLKHVVLAFDMDWQTNKFVKKALRDLETAITKKGFSRFILVWDNEKGYDDYLLKREI